MISVDSFSVELMQDEESGRTFIELNGILSLLQTVVDEAEDCKETLSQLILGFAKNID